MCNLSIGNVKKLVSSAFDKEDYGVHYKHLQIYLRLGLTLKEMHRELELNQSQRLKQSKQRKKNN